MPTPAPAPVPPPPPPAPVPAPSPGQLPQTTALRESLCNPYVDVTKKVSYLATPVIPASVTITSGAGNGGAAVGNGDSTDGSVKVDFAVNPMTVGTLSNSQSITPPAQYVQNKIICAFDVKIAVEVVTGTINGTNYNPSFTKAIDVKIGSATYGQNIASTDPTTAKALALRAVRMTSVMINPVTSSAGSIGINLLRNDTGLRCVAGYFYIRFSARTQVENSNITQDFTANDANYKYVKVDVKDGCWAESKLKPALDPVRISGYGTAVASSVNWMAVLATKDDGLLNNASVSGTGTVSMFKKNGSNWDFCQKITVPNAVAFEGLTSVALASDNSMMAIGSSGAKDLAGNKAGAVHIYNYNANGSCASGTMWVWGQKISPDTNSQVGNASSNKTQLFGVSVALTNSRLVVGASGANNNNGAIYIYSCSAGSCNYANQYLNVEGTNAGFGSSLSLSNNSIVAVGAPQAFGRETEGDGFVVVLDVSVGANVLTKVKPSDVPNETRTNMRFGDSVSLSGNRLLVGAPYRSAVDGNGVVFSGSGAAYYFNYAGQSTPTTAVTPAMTRIEGNNTANLYVGRAVALGAGGLFVSQDGINTREGNVSYFTDARILGLAGTTTKISINDFTLFSLDKSASNDFGYAISVTGNYVLIGARVKPSPNVGGGAAYVYLKP